MLWALAQETGSPTDKAVLLVLAAYANDEGRCFPSVRTLSFVTELCDRTVRKALHRLLAQRLIELIGPRYRGSELVSNEHRLPIDGPPRTPAPGAAEGLPPLQEIQGPPAAEDHAPLHQMQGEPKWGNQPGNQYEQVQQAGSDKSSLASGFDALCQHWEPSGLQNLKRARTLWSELGDADRATALRWAPVFLAAVREAGGRVPWVSSYIEDASWRLAPAASVLARPDGATVLLPFTREWTFEFFRRLEAGEDLRKVVHIAKAGAGIRVPAPPTEEQLAGFVRAAVGSRQEIAWRRYVSARGVELPRPTSGNFIWIPAGVPPDADDADGGRS